MATFTIDLLTGGIYLFNGDFTESGSSVPTSGSTYPEVNLFSDLPDVSINSGKIYVVRSASGLFIVNRKDAGLYYSTGTVWKRLGDVPSYFNSINFKIYDGIDNTKGFKYNTSGLTSGIFRNIEFQDTDGVVALLTDVQNKLDQAVFTEYTGDTNTILLNLQTNIDYLSGVTDTKLNINLFNAFTGDTNIILENLQANIDYLSGVTDTKLNITLFDTFTGDTYTLYNNIKDPTGFIDNINIDVSYDSVNRTITLTKATNIQYYWRGRLYSLGTSWTSSGHSDTTDGWFLSSTDGINFTWSMGGWVFSDLMVAYRPSNTNIAIREVHGIMANTTHEELHRNFGCYRINGFGLTSSTYTLQPSSPVNSDNTFGLEAGIVADEDLKSIIYSSAENSYTRIYFTSTGITNIELTQSLPFRTGTTYPLINTFNGATFTEVEASSGRYFNYYVIRIPVTSDANSQLFRAIILQPQFQYTSLLQAQAESTLSLVFGDFTLLTPETVLVERITMRSQSVYNSATGRVRIEAVSILSGSKFSQTSTNVIGGATTAGNVSVVPLAPFTSINLQDLSSEYGVELNSLNYLKNSTIQLIDSSGNTEINSNIPTSIIWTLQEFSGNSLSFTGGSKIYVTTNGYYEISYLINNENQTNSVKNIGFVIRKNNDTIISATTTTTIVYDIVNSKSSCLLSPYKISLNVGDYIELVGYKIGNDGSVLTIPNLSWIRLKKIS